MLLADRRNILEVWRKVFGDLEKKHGEIQWRFRGDVFGDFGEIVFGDFGEIVFGDIVGDLEERGRRSYGDYVLEFVMK